MSPHRATQRGVSLLEALVALAVMAFGMLGIVGIQSSLRQNSDASRHRSESMRIAQEAIERARAYSVTQAAAPPKVSFDGFVTGAATAIAGYTTNTTYTRTVTVANQPNAVLTPATAPSLPELVPRPIIKTARSSVTWTDRSGTPQANALTAMLHRSPPELAGSLVISGSGTAAQLPGGRHYSIPRSAVDRGDGTSEFAPPGTLGTVQWFFSNSTGMITRVCSPTFGGCRVVSALLLEGTILFDSIDVTPPTPAMAESPPGLTFSVNTAVNLTFPPIGVGAGFVPAPECFTELPSPTRTIGLQYFCVVFVLPGSPQWSGRTALSSFPIATSVSDPGPVPPAAPSYRVCRYTTTRSHAIVGTGTPPMTNQDHPLDYLNAGVSLVNQNFLIIRAGDGAAAFPCPDDDPATTLVNGRTWHHQPDS